MCVCVYIHACVLVVAICIKTLEFVLCSKYATYTITERLVSMFLKLYADILYTAGYLFNFLCNLIYIFRLPNGLIEDICSIVFGER